MTKKVSEKEAELIEQIADLTADLQRTRADFENYRKRVESDLERATSTGESRAVARLLPLIDILETATTHVPDDLKENSWAQGVVAARKNLDKMMDEIDLKLIEAKVGTHFDPDLHHAVQFDEDSDGEHEVIAEVLQNGYTYRGNVLRPAMVKVHRED
ncbi:nucleotide exchange factor GrpE [Candidatus Saccharibacteria bacterium]|nr:nucleotide exchange factor GrpE [Candidatus Saccharibacteria bacterium]